MTYQLTVYFDGLCHLCSREIDFYRKQERADRIDWVDISHPSFNALSVGLDAQELQFYLHARRPSGEILQGVDTFIEIWRVLEMNSFLVAFAEAPVIKPFLRAGYHAFALARPFLPKKKRNECESGSCNIALGKKFHPGKSNEGK